MNPYAEADLIATFFSGEIGRFSAIARGARRIRKGAVPVLEPVHTLALELADRPGQGLMTLRSSTIALARTRLTAQLARLEAAGRALRWVRETVPVRTPEPDIWSELIALLDRLDAADLRVDSESMLAHYGLRLLRAIGYGLNLTSCVACGRVCEPGKASCVDAVRGGLLCRACGGAPRVLRGTLRASLLVASEGGEAPLDPGEAALVLELVDEALRAHADLRA